MELYKMKTLQFINIKASPQHMHEVRFNRDKELEERLGKAFLEASKGNISLERLREIASEIRDKAVEKDPKGWDDKFSYALLKDAVEEADTLHDWFTREHYNKHNEELISYSNKLLGVKEANYPFEIANDIVVILKYNPYSK